MDATILSFPLALILLSCVIVAVTCFMAGSRFFLYKVHDGSSSYGNCPRADENSWIAIRVI